MITKEPLPTIKTELQIEAKVIEKALKTKDDHFPYVVAVVKDKDHLSPYVISIDEKTAPLIEVGKTYQLKFYYVFSPMNDYGFRIQSTLLEVK